MESTWHPKWIVQLPTTRVSYNKAKWNIQCTYHLSVCMQSSIINGMYLTSATVSIIKLANETDSSNDNQSKYLSKSVSHPVTEICRYRGSTRVKAGNKTIAIVG